MKKAIVPTFLLVLGGFLQASIPGDIDSSGCVDMTDISIFSAAWLSNNSPSANWNPACDIPNANDGIVNGLDFAILADHWLLTAPDSNEMAFIPGGEYWMGDHFSEGNTDEFPLHFVEVDAFYIGKYEVTNGQYCDFLNAAFESSEVYISGNVVYGNANDEEYCNTAAGSASLIDFAVDFFSVDTKTEGGREMSDDPMILVSWYGAAAYCNWRSEQDGYQACYNLSTWECDFTKRGYRLPTEAEWEYAARGGQYSPYGRFSWGDPNTISHSQANYKSDGSVSYDVSPTAGYHPLYDDGTDPRTAPLGSFPPNGYGLYDTVGNVYEWCNDWYSNTYYSSVPNPVTNPTGPVSGIYRVIRGGSYAWNANYCRTSNRYVGQLGPDHRRSDFGFRICLNLN